MQATTIWRLFVDAPQPGAANMAIDEALFEGVKAGSRPVLRLYRWHPPCLSLGRNQRALGRYDPERARAEGMEIVRRPTGGSAVLHDQELTYAVALPGALTGGPRQTYLALNRALVRGLTRLGVPAVTVERAAAPVPLDRIHDPCFARAAPGEVAAAGRKLVGSAQRCERRTVLQHGSILLDGDQSAVSRLQSGVGPPARTASISLRELLNRLPEPAELEAAIVAGFEQELGVRFEADEYSPSERELRTRLEKKYESPEWTWRR